jgi:hypothetical protein
MTKKIFIHTALSEFIIVFLLFCCLTGCSKEDQDSYTNEIRIDLADTTYHRLLHTDGNYILSGTRSNIRIVNTPGGYAAADLYCPVCGGIIAYTPDMNPWRCISCLSRWTANGTGYNNNHSTLKVYNVRQSGNVLIIHL